MVPSLVLPPERIMPYMFPSGPYTILKHFDNATTGGNPSGSLVQDTDSNFYGMTTSGGSSEYGHGYGTIFRMTQSGSYTVLHRFTDSTGGNPYGSLIKGLDGAFYGMTQTAGRYNAGTIFKILPNGTFGVIKHLEPAVTGGSPKGSLVFGDDGSLYGMTHTGGKFNGGTIFKCSVAGALFVLRHLNIDEDGGNPYGSLLKNSDGYFYGMAMNGGTKNENGDGSGTIFKISASGAYTVLTRLQDNAEGMYPGKSLVQGKDGYFYGMAREGGKFGYGTIYRLCTDGSFTALHSFERKTTGAWPYGSLIQAKDGYFYGMTSRGGTFDAGTIFKMSQSGSVTVIKHFDPSNGRYSPIGSLVQASDGNFYGMTRDGNAYYTGSIFKVTPAGEFTVLKILDGSTGVYPNGSLIQASDGNLYGMTPKGGANGQGTVFRITLSGTFKVIKDLTHNYFSEYSGDLVQAKDGNLYGIGIGGTYGSGYLFRVTLSGTFTVLKEYAPPYNINVSYGILVQGSDGSFYSIANSGGATNNGIIFKIAPDWNLTILRSLNYATHGTPTLPTSLIIQKPDPVASPQAWSTQKEIKKKVKLTASGGAPLTFAISKGPINGTATITKDSLTYTPKTGFVGADSLYFTATWGCQKSIPAKVRITVTATPTVPATMGGNGQLSVLAEDSSAAGTLQAEAFPNPFSDNFKLFISGATDAPVQLRVFNASGMIVETRSRVAVKGTLSLGLRYKPGLYYIEVVQGSQRVILKLIKGLK